MDEVEGAVGLDVRAVGTTVADIGPLDPRFAPAAAVGIVDGSFVEDAWAAMMVITRAALPTGALVANAIRGAGTQLPTVRRGR